MTIFDGTDKDYKNHRAKSVRRLANVELLVISLAVSRSEVVDNRIPPNVIHGFILGYTESLLPNNHAHFALIVESLGKLMVRKYLMTVGDDGGKALGEDDWMSWLVFFV